MSMTYTDEDRALGYTDRPLGQVETRREPETDFVPAYARGRRTQKKLKTWMILAPLGLLVLAGGAVAMLTRPAEPAAPLAEPPAVAPMVAPMTPAPNTAVVDNALITAEPMEATPAPAPAVRSAEPLRRAAPTPAPARRAAPAATPAPTPAEPTGLRAYTPSASTGASASAPAPRIVTQPLPIAPAPSTPAPAPAPAITTTPLT